jgi:hypothetical protein
VGYGGATWDTAGTLTLDADNTFDIADTVDEPPLIEPAWWTYTPTVPGVLALDGDFLIRVYRGTDDDRIQHFAPFGVGGWILTEGVEYHILAYRGVADDPPEFDAYQITASYTQWATSPWFTDLQENDENWVYVPAGNTERGGFDEAWMADCVRTGSRRLGSYWLQESLGGPWGTDARDCAIAHAIHGDQDGAIIWDDTCPPLGSGSADLEIIGNSSTSYHYSETTGGVFVGDTAIMSVRTVAYGIWLKPVEDNSHPWGYLNTPSPVDYGYPEDAQLVWEDDHPTTWKVEVADAAGTEGVDPDSQYAVNYDRQPTFSDGDWGAWTKGVLPGEPIPAAPTAQFESEATDLAGKTWNELAVPETITEDYVNDSPDYTVVAGPAEVFGPAATITTDRTAATAVAAKVYVRASRFRFVYDGPIPVAVTTVPPRRIFGRPDGMTTGAARALGGGNTVQSGNRTLGSIL